MIKMKANKNRRQLIKALNNVTLARHIWTCSDLLQQVVKLYHTGCLRKITNTNSGISNHRCRLYNYRFTYIRSSCAAVCFFPSVCGMTLVGAFVVLVSLAWLVRLMVLAGCGTVCDITGAFVLFIRICGGWPFIKLCPFLTSLCVHVLVFPPFSATAGCVTLSAAFELHLLAGPEDVCEGTLYFCPFFSPSRSDLCFGNRSVSCLTDLLCLEISTVPPVFTGPFVLLEKWDVDFSPLDS